MSRRSCTLIIGITSGIGEALAEHLRSLGEIVVGTSRSVSDSRVNMHEVLTLDVSSLDSATAFVENFSKDYAWTKLVFCPAVMSPIGPFEEIDIDKWVATFNINFTNQVYLLRKLLPVCKGEMPRVIFFAGGGTNSAPKNYSAYILSKISLIKLVELLNEEIQTICFSIIGPGWVKTKIHEQSLAPSLERLDSFNETKRRILESDFVPMEKVIRSIMWVLSQDKEIAGGRNFSSADDPFESENFIELLSQDYNALKLRRHWNAGSVTNHKHSQ